MTTTAKPDHRHLLAPISAKDLAKLSAPLTAEQDNLIADFAARHRGDEPLRDLIHAALDPGGDPTDPAGYAVLADRDLCTAYLERATR